MVREFFVKDVGTFNTFYQTYYFTTASIYKIVGSIPTFLS